VVPGKNEEKSVAKNVFWARARNRLAQPPGLTFWGRGREEDQVIGSSSGDTYPHGETGSGTAGHGMVYGAGPWFCGEEGFAAAPKLRDCCTHLPGDGGAARRPSVREAIHVTGTGGGEFGRFVPIAIPCPKWCPNPGTPDSKCFWRSCSLVFGAVFWPSLGKKFTGGVIVAYSMRQAATGNGPYVGP